MIYIGGCEMGGLRIEKEVKDDQEIKGQVKKEENEEKDKGKI